MNSICLQVTKLVSSRGFCRPGQVLLPLRATSTVSHATKQGLEGELEDIRNAGTFKSERVILSKQGPAIDVHGSTEKILNFCANNYLGLSSHPEVIEAGKKALDTHGAGLSSVRFICGTMDIHKELEEKLAKFHGKEDAILYISCFDANAGLFEVLMSPEDAILSDELNHASIIDGIRLCKAHRYRYKHSDMTELEEQLKETQSCRRRLIATDGVFSMDGNVAKLDKICELAHKYQALVFIDECHATGFFGPTGRGTEEYFGLDGKVDIINSTLGKAVGGAAGGYTAGPQELVTLLRQRSRPYLFSNSLPPPVVACASKALDLIMENTDLPNLVLRNTQMFRSKMTEAGFKLSHHLSYFHNSLNATALFENWILDTNGSIFLACLCTFLLALGYQGTKWFRQYLHVNYGNKIHSIKSKEHLLQTLLYVTEFIVSYILMLLVMTYNIWVFVLTVFGITLGYFLLAWHKEFKTTGCAKDCPNVIEHKNKDYERNPSAQELMPLENGSQPGACGGCGIEVIEKIEEVG